MSQNSQKVKEIEKKLCCDFLILFSNRRTTQNTDGCGIAVGECWDYFLIFQDFLGLEFQAHADFVASLLEVLAVDQSGQIQSHSCKDKNKIEIDKSGQKWTKWVNIDKSV